MGLKEELSLGRMLNSSCELVMSAEKQAESPKAHRDLHFDFFSENRAKLREWGHLHAVTGLAGTVGFPREGRGVSSNHARLHMTQRCLDSQKDRVWVGAHSKGMSVLIYVQDIKYCSICIFFNSRVRVVKSHMSTKFEYNQNYFFRWNLPKP